MKTSIMRYNITKFLFNIFIFFKKNRNMEKQYQLVTQFDGIGDGVIRLELLRVIAREYGKENIVVLTKNCYEILKLEGYNVIKCENLFHIKITKLLKLYIKLKKYYFQNLFMMEFKKDKEVDFLMKFDFAKVYAYEGDGLDDWKKRHYLQLISKSNGEIIESVYNFAKILTENIEKENLRPRLNFPVEESEYVTIGVGAGGNYKVASPVVVAEFMNYIISVQPNIKFHILGSGKNQVEYCKKLEELVSKKNMTNYVNKLNLTEAMSQIAKASYHIGFDSGLYNIAYALNKKILAIVSMKNSQSCYHTSKNIQFVHRKDGDGIVREINDKIYTNEDLNQIPAERFIEKYDLLINQFN